MRNIGSAQMTRSSYKHYSITLIEPVETATIIPGRTYSKGLTSAGTKVISPRAEQPVFSSETATQLCNLIFWQRRILRLNELYVSCPEAGRSWVRSITA